jgi:hypothetical protein
MSQKGHKQPSRPLGLSGGFRHTERTFIKARGNGTGAPIPDG